MIIEFLEYEIGLKQVIQIPFSKYIQKALCSYLDIFYPSSAWSNRGCAMS